MDIQSAYREVGTYRGAAEICSTTPKTVKRVIEAQERIGDLPAVAHNYDQVRELVAARVKKTKARISAKRRPAGSRRMRQMARFEPLRSAKSTAGDWDPAEEDGGADADGCPRTGTSRIGPAGHLNRSVSCPGDPTAGELPCWSAGGSTAQSVGRPGSPVSRRPWSPRVR